MPHRRMSGVERLWLAAAGIRPPFVIQFVLELDASPELARLQEALDQVVKANPGARVRRRGWLWGTRWSPDGPAPQVRLVTAPAWTGRSEVGGDFLNESIPDDAVMELLRVDSPPACRLVLRVQHCAIDGRGGWHLVEELFRALRGDPLLGSPFPGPTDLELSRQLQAVRSAVPEPEAMGVTGAPTAGEDMDQMRWRRVTLGPTPDRLLARTLVALGRHVQPTPGATMRVDIPVDLRRHLDGQRSTANLTGLLHINPHDTLRAQDPVAATAEHLAAGLERGDHLGPVLAAEPLLGLPLWLITMVGRSRAKREHARARSPVSATVSNLGRIHRDRLRAPGLDCTGAFWIPPFNPGLSLFLGLIGDLQGAELCFVVPATWAAEGRLDALCTAMEDALTGGG